MKSLSHVRLFATPWAVAHQAPLSMGFSRQEYWSGLPFPSPGDPPNPVIEPGSPALQADAVFCDPIVSSPLGSSVHGMSQARILEWVAISFSRGLPLLGIKSTDSSPLSHQGNPWGPNGSACSLPCSGRSFLSGSFFFVLLLLII